MTFRILTAVAALAVGAGSASAQYSGGVPIYGGPSNAAVPSYGYSQPNYGYAQQSFSYYGQPRFSYRPAQPSYSYNFIQPGYTRSNSSPTYGLVAPLHGSLYGLNLGQSYNANGAAYAPLPRPYVSGYYNSPNTSPYRGANGQFGPYRWR